MTSDELKEILEAHAKWLRGEAGGLPADLSGMDLRSHADALRSASLRGSSLRHSNLRGSNLRHSNLRGSNLRGSDLSVSDLAYANLSGSNLSGSGLRCADLSGANLVDANLAGANLSHANLAGSDLCGANLLAAYLSDANLAGANLSGANLSGANLAGVIAGDLVLAQTSIVPDSGPFIAWKKLRGGHVAKLMIPEDAKRSNATGRKCRASSAKVVAIFGPDGKKARRKVASCHDENFVYVAGKVVRARNFDSNRWNECAPGIHFFITRAEAEEYVP